MIKYDELIFVNGGRLERELGASPVSLVWESPFVSAPGNIVSNRTNTIDFPLTRKNMAVLERLHIIQDSQLPFRKLEARYVRCPFYVNRNNQLLSGVYIVANVPYDGPTLLHGTATVQSLTKDKITLSFVWGNADAIQDMLGRSLRELVPDIGHLRWVDWSEDGVAQHDTLFASNVRFTSRVSYTDHAHPFVSVATLLDYIAGTFGIQIDLDAQERLCLPLLTRDDSADTHPYNDVRYVTGKVWHTVNEYPDPQYNTGNWILMPDGSTDLDFNGRYLDNGVIDVTDLDTVNLDIDGDYFHWSTMNASQTPEYGSIQIVPCDEAGDTGGHVDIARIELAPGEISGSRRKCVASTQRHISADVSQYTHIIVRYGDASTAMEAPVSVGVTSLRIYKDFEEGDEVPWGGRYPLVANYPDWTCEEFIKTLMKLTGTVCEWRGDRHVALVPYSSLFGNKAGAVDWSDRTDDILGTTTFSKLTAAKVWNISFEKDEDVHVSPDRAIATGNDTGAYSSDLLKLPVTTSDTYGSGAYRIGLYDITVDEDGNDVYEAADVKQRVFSIDDDQPLTVSNGPDGAAIETMLAPFIASLKRPRVLKLTVWLDDADIFVLDTKRPVYLRQTGRYYALSKLTVKGAGGKCEAELILMQ